MFEISPTQFARRQSLSAARYFLASDRAIMAEQKKNIESGTESVLSNAFTPSSYSYGTTEDDVTLDGSISLQESSVPRSDSSFIIRDIASGRVLIL